MAVTEANVTRELQDIRNDLTMLRKDLSELTHAVQVNVRNETRHLGEEARHVAEMTRERGEKVVHQVEHRIEERPFFSVFSAFGVGLLAGWLAERRVLTHR
jgi:ElaB/YqjD/DUF883 family membrane-anchored ribosome-binding protein